MLKLWKVGNSKFLSQRLETVFIPYDNFNKIMNKKFSGAHHSGSGSDDEHGHGEHDSDHTDHDPHENIDHDIPITPVVNHARDERTRIFSPKDEFSVENILNSMRVPLKSSEKKIHPSDIETFKTENEYLNFLARSFEKQALNKYPEYKKHFDEYKHLIPNYDKLNQYQKEAYTLDTYLHWELEQKEFETRELYNFSGTALERNKQRWDFFQKLIQEDHHHDTTIMHHLKEKLKEILKGEMIQENFKARYQEIVENKLLNQIVEKRQTNYYFDIVKNKAVVNKELENLNAPGNKYKFVSSIQPHDHINPQHLLHDPEKVNEEKWKYLAYFDIIIDQHLRQARPSSISTTDELFKYVKDENKPLKHVEDHTLDNMYWTYNFTLDNEFFRKHNEELQEFVQTKINKEFIDECDEYDKHHPVGRLWKDKHKFPHVADRIGWDFLQETPWDKNPFIERVESHPNYQHQPFVQTPPMEPDKDLCLEEGEVIYENKYVFEWITFWRLLIILSPITIWMLIYEGYNNDTAPSPEYLGRFGIPVHPFNKTQNGINRKIPHMINYWGSEMWPWQVVLRKGLVYPLAIIGAIIWARTYKYIGIDYVLKAMYNREKDIVFVWRSCGLFNKTLNVYELHFLEQMVPRSASSYKDLGQLKKDGIFTVYDMRLDHELTFYNEKKYWNLDQRDHFFKNTTTLWKGLRSKNLDKGVIIDNSYEYNQEQLLWAQKINGEIKDAIEKYGPVQVTDYEYNYRYQLKKRIQDIKRDLIEGKSIDTSIYSERVENTNEDHSHAKIAAHH